MIFLRKKLQETINYYEERLDQQEKSISELFDKKVTNLDEEVNNLKRSIDEKDQKVKKLTELEQKLKSYESEKVQLTKNLSLLEYDYEQIKNKLIEIESEKNKNEETLSEFKNKENDTLILKELYNKLQIDSKKIENEYNKSINDLELSEKERILLQEKIDLISKDFEELKELKTIAERKFIQELDTSLKDSEKKHTKELKEKITTIKENETKITNFLKEITQLKENEIILKSELAKAKRLDLINLETLNNYIDFISERVYDVRRVLFHKIFHYIIDFKIKNEYNILTTKMIADTLGISLPTLYAELKELELKNIISFEKSEEIKSYYDYPINIGLQNRKSE